MTKPAASELLVVCLCADWCGVCREYRRGFEALARQRPQTAFQWIDVEADADWLGDLDVENFPTVLVQRGETLLFFGTMLPQPVHLQRTLDALGARSVEEALAQATARADDQTWQLACRLGKALMQRYRDGAH